MVRANSLATFIAGVIVSVIAGVIVGGSGCVRDNPICGSEDCAAERDLTNNSSQSKVATDGRAWEAPDELAFLDGPPIWDPQAGDQQPPPHTVLTQRAARQTRLRNRLRELGLLGHSARVV